MQAKRQEAEASGAERIEKLVRSWEKLAHDPNVSTAYRLKAGELLGKYHGVFSETRIMEVSTRQRQLTEVEQAEAKRLAAMRFDCNLLPPPDLGRTSRSVGEIVEAEVIQSGPKAGSNMADTDGQAPALADDSSHDSTEIEGDARGEGVEGSMPPKAGGPAIP